MYQLCLHWKWNQVLRDKCFYLDRSSNGCKKFQRVHRKPFLTNFHFFYSFYHRPKFYYYRPAVLYELSLLWKCAHALKEMSFYLERSRVGCNKLSPSRTIFDNFPFFKILFTIGQPFTSIGQSIILSESTQMNCASSARLTKSLE